MSEFTIYAAHYVQRLHSWVSGSRQLRDQARAARPVKYDQSHWRWTRRRFCSCGNENSQVTYRDGHPSIIGVARRVEPSQAIGQALRACLGSSHAHTDRRREYSPLSIGIARAPREFL